MAKKNSKGKSAVDEALKNIPTSSSSMDGVTNVERPKGIKTIVDSTNWFKFSLEGVKTFAGYFVEKVVAQKDDKSRQRKKGDVMGYMFVQDGTGKEFALPYAHAITTALEHEGYSTKVKFYIEFQGKVAGGNGKNPYNRFYVGKF